MGPRKVVALELDFLSRRASEKRSARDGRRRQLLDETLLRQSNRMRELVLRLLKTGRDPKPEDLAAALVEPAPDPLTSYRVALTEEDRRAWLSNPPTDEGAWFAERITDNRRREAIAQARVAISADTKLLLEYVAKTYVLGRPRKPGRKTAARSLTEELQISAEYIAELERARERWVENNREPRAVAAHAKKVVAKKHGLSVRTIEAIIAGLNPRFAEPSGE